MRPLRFKWFWLGGGLGCVALILMLALAPMSGRLPSLGSDKLAHFLGFVFLTVWFMGVVQASLALRVVVALAGYGLLIELLQSFTAYRVAETYDVAADFLGIGVGWLLAWAGLRHWCARVEALLGADPS